MQASIARHGNLFSVHVVIPQIHIKKDDFATSNSTKHLMYSLCELINNNQKQSNLSLTMLKSINLSGNDIFSQSPVKKDRLLLRPQLNIWYKCLGGPKNPIWFFEIKFTFVA